jgi:hypothetical protein
MCRRWNLSGNATFELVTVTARTLISKRLHPEIMSFEKIPAYLQSGFCQYSQNDYGSVLLEAKDNCSSPQSCRSSAFAVSNECSRSEELFSRYFPPLTTGFGIAWKRGNYTMMSPKLNLLLSMRRLGWSFPTVPLPFQTQHIDVEKRVTTCCDEANNRGSWKKSDVYVRTS